MSTVTPLQPINGSLEREPEHNQYYVKTLGEDPGLIQDRYLQGQLDTLSQIGEFLQRLHERTWTYAPIQIDEARTICHRILLDNWFINATDNERTYVNSTSDKLHVALKCIEDDLCQLLVPQSTAGNHTAEFQHGGGDFQLYPQNDQTDTLSEEYPNRNSDQFSSPTLPNTSYSTPATSIASYSSPVTTHTQPASGFYRVIGLTGQHYLSPVLPSASPVLPSTKSLATEPGEVTAKLPECYKEHETWFRDFLQGWRDTHEREDMHTFVLLLNEQQDTIEELARALREIGDDTLDIEKPGDLEMRAMKPEEVYTAAVNLAFEIQTRHRLGGLKKNKGNSLVNVSYEHRVQRVCNYLQRCKNSCARLCKPPFITDVVDMPDKMLERFITNTHGNASKASKRKANDTTFGNSNSRVTRKSAKQSSRTTSNPMLTKQQRARNITSHARESAHQRAATQQQYEFDDNDCDDGAEEFIHVRQRENSQHHINAHRLTNNVPLEPIDPIFRHLGRQCGPYPIF